MLWFQDWGILCGSRIVTSLRKRDLHGIPPATAGPQSEGASDSSLRIPSGTIYFLIVLFAFPEVLSPLSPLACAGPGVALPVPVSDTAITPGAGVCGTAGGAPIAIGSAVAHRTSFQNRHQPLSTAEFNDLKPPLMGNVLAQSLDLPGAVPRRHQR